MKLNPRSMTVALGLSALTLSVQAALQPPIDYPSPQSIDQRGEINFISSSDLQEFRALDEYREAEYLTKLVHEGQLPPVEERLPEKPMVYKTSSMNDGMGVYGGVLRMASMEPQGWNWAGGNHQGYGGVNYLVQECLTRTGPLFQIKPEEIEPLPNLAKSWEWSEDGLQLTMNLIREAKWSDGHPFSADDVMFLWEDNILDPNVPSNSSRNVFGENAELVKVDDNTIRWTFDEPYQTQNLFSMSAFQFCPGPAHVLKEEHPRYNEDKTYNDYLHAFGPGRTPWVTMSAWTVVDYRPSQALVFRRNPYFWKVDESGQQLPYLSEVQFLPVGFAARTPQAMAGNVDISNLENPPIYTETLRQASREDSPIRLAFGPRTLGWQLHMNLAESYGAQSEREKLIRQLNRDFRFRRAVSHAIDRESLGQYQQKTMILNY